MMAVIHSMREAVEQYIASGPHTSPQDGQVIVSACDRLFSDLACVQREYQTPELIQLGINQCYLFLVSVLDQAWASAMEPYLLDKLRITMQTFEEIYGSHIDPRSRLSHIEQDDLLRKTQLLFAEIRPRLEAKHITSEYIAEIAYALDTVFQSGKLPDLHYYHRSYLQRFMQALTYLADEERDKDWPARFVVLMIQYNFNYLGFFNRWREQLAATVQQLETPLQVYQYLRQVEDMLQCSYHRPDLHYDISRGPLLEDMLEHTSAAVEQARRYSEEASQDTDTSLITTLNANELNVLFYYLYDRRVLDYPTKREAAKAFSRSIQSKTGRNISYKTFEKFDRDHLEDSANKILRLLKTVGSAIEKDFRR